MNAETRKLIWRLWWLIDFVVEQTSDTLFIDDDSLHEVFANLVSELDPELATSLFADLENPESTRPAGLFPVEKAEE